jgi:hypothetical protein
MKCPFDKLMKVFVRHQDVTKEIVKLCVLTKPKAMFQGIRVLVPASKQLLKDEGFQGGWANITGLN